MLVRACYWLDQRVMRQHYITNRMVIHYPTELIYEVGLRWTKYDNEQFISAMMMQRRINEQQKNERHERIVQEARQMLQVQQLHPISIQAKTHSEFDQSYV